MEAYYRENAKITAQAKQQVKDNELQSLRLNCELKNSLKRAEQHQQWIERWYQKTGERLETVINSPQSLSQIQIENLNGDANSNDSNGTYPLFHDYNQICDAIATRLNREKNQYNDCITELKKYKSKSNYLDSKLVESKQQNENLISMVENLERNLEDRNRLLQKTYEMYQDMLNREQDVENDRIHNEILQIQLEDMKRKLIKQDHVTVLNDNIKSESGGLGSVVTYDLSANDSDDEVMVNHNGVTTTSKSKKVPKATVVSGTSSESLTKAKAAIFEKKKTEFGNDDNLSDWYSQESVSDHHDDDNNVKNCAARLKSSTNTKKRGPGSAGPKTKRIKK